LTQLADRHPHSLSFGQAKRVAIAKAFVGDVVLLDEPTAGQDYTFRRKLLEVARSLGKTVILATHDLKLAEGCDEVIELS
jgi:energy-coupling factor transporter ATP-binding protein EcfA2